MGFFLMMFLFFCLMRMMSHGRRHHFVRMHYHGRTHSHHRICSQPFYARQVPVAETQKPQASAYERLKRRYVDDEIDVEQYERELDELLRSPEAKRFVN